MGGGHEKEKRERLGYNGRNSHFNSENLFHFGWLTLSSGGLWLIWVNCGYVPFLLLLLILFGC